MQMKLNICRIRLLFLCTIFLFTIGCSSNSHNQATASNSMPNQYAPSKANTPLRDNTPQVLTPQASGITVYESNIVTIDISNVSQGYLILTYWGINEKVKFQIQAPNSVTYTYLVTDYSEAIVYPLTGGNGTYSLSLLESVDPDENLYAIAYTQTVDANITNEFLPYLTPNVYVNYTSESTTVKKGMELAENCYSDLDVIENIYHYVTKNITYDTAKAQSVAYGYIPNPSETLAAKKGICFDYASLMTGMLRSQQIPTKLEVGYAGELYHAWISCYVDEIGWIDNIIKFDGKSWSLMDPTLAANNSDSAVQKYIGDGSNYVAKYTY